MDRSYRYKMPKLIAKVEGRGNGIKTRIVNCGEIASALHRKPGVVTKFFGCELGAQSRWEDKEEASIVNGAFEGAIMQAKLCDVFLPKFVLCANCGLPETDMKVKKEVVKFECAACGHAYDADMRHKLITYILADDKKAKEAKKKDKKKEAKEGGGDKADKKEKGDGDKEEKKEKKKDKEKSKDKEKKKEKKAKKKEESDEEEWFTDISLEAVEARRQAEMEKMGAKAAADNLQEIDAPPAEEAAAVEEIVEKAAKIDLDASNELLNALMAQIGESKKAKEVMAAAGAWMEDTEVPEAKNTLFYVLENLPENVMKHSNIVLKVMYDHDAVTDEDVFAWHAAADAENPAVANAQAFVDFLKED